MLVCPWQELNRTDSMASKLLASWKRWMLTKSNIVPQRFHLVLMNPFLDHLHCNQVCDQYKDVDMDSYLRKEFFREFILFLNWHIFDVSRLNIMSINNNKWIGVKVPYLAVINWMVDKVEVSKCLWVTISDN